MPVPVICGLWLDGGARAVASHLPAYLQVCTIPILAEGREALKKINADMGLGMDEVDVEYYTKLFQKMGRCAGRCCVAVSSPPPPSCRRCRTHMLRCIMQRSDPTNVEMFDFGQSNSEHSRHWFFKGKIVIDGEEQKQDLMDVVGSTMTGPMANDNSIIAFHDNSSAIRGYPGQSLMPSEPGKPCKMEPRDALAHITFTAETHNFPSECDNHCCGRTGV